MALASCRTFHPGQSSGRTEHPERPRNRKVPEVVHFLQPPLANDNRISESCRIQYRERNDFAPRRGVAHAAIQRVWPIFREADDVGPWFAAREAASHARGRRADKNQRQPRQHTTISPKALLDEVEDQGAGGNEEDEYPDRPVQEPIIKLVAIADLTLEIEFDIARIRAHVRVVHR